MRIRKLTLYTNKLTEQKLFFQKVFDYTIISEDDCQFTLQIGWTELTFIRKSEPYLYHYCFLLPKMKLESAAKWLKTNVELLPDPRGSEIHEHVHWNARAIYFKDGGGNIGEIIVHNNLSYESSGSFSPKDILGINEIGMPSSDSRALNNYLESKVGTRIWKGEIDRFVSNGDEEGMFLLVNNMIKDRWYPTDLFPQSSPFEITIKVDGKTIEVSFNGKTIDSINTQITS